MTKQVRLSFYERGIVEELEKLFNYKHDEARQIVIHYIQVIRKLGGYNNCDDYANILHKAYTTQYTAHKWLARIEKREAAFENAQKEDSSFLVAR